MARGRQPAPTPERDAYIEHLRLKQVEKERAMAASLEEAEWDRLLMEEAEFLATGYFLSGGGRCCLCGEKTPCGDWVRTMPPSWNPRRNKHRIAHKSCLERLMDQIYEDTGVLVVP